MTLALAALLAVQALDEQALLSLLEKRFGGGDVSWILVDAASGRRVGAHWPEEARPVALGSLVKPFTVLAYGASHGYRFPEFVCSGGCWLPRGHGRLRIAEALAQSCNSYFDQLARTTAVDDVRTVAARYGIEAPAAGASLIGRADGWKITPLKLIRAYCELARRGGEPGVDEVLSGLAASAAHGTAKAVGGAALAKTGTAPCVHRPRAPGDGFTVVLFPAPKPRFGLLLRVHGVPGSESARRAGELLRVMR